MKILLASNSYPTPEYPMQAFIGVLSRELVRQGHEVTVIAPCLVFSCLRHGIGLDKKHYFDEFEYQGEKKFVEVYRPRVYAPGEGRLTKLVSWICQKRMSSEALSIGRRFDVAYAHFWSSAIHLKDYVEKTGTPLVVACGEDKINIRYLRNHYNTARIKELTKGVICVSSKNREESVTAGLTEEKKCMVLPNAVDAEEFRKLNKSEVRRELGFPDDLFIVGFLGRFNARKGAGRVSEAIKKCNDDNIKAIYIGKKTTGDTFVPSDSEALFYGALPHSDVVKYLNAADAFVLPTLAEGCSNAIVEAMACGLPIISSDLPFNYDILDESNSILVDPMNVDAIKEGITRLKCNPELCGQMSASSLEKAQELTISNRAKKIIEFIGKSIS